MQRIFVAEIPCPEADDEETEPHPQSGQVYVLVNPEIIRRSEALVEGKEGCLSMPGWYGLVERAEWIEVKALNEHGKKINLQVDGLLARIFQHEIDHLNGVLFVDHINDRDKLWQVIDEVEAESETSNA
jgi:peptide deformylase